MSSWPPPSTSGRCSPNGHGAWSTRPHSPSSSPSGSSGSTPTRTTSSSTRSWARAQRSWPPAASSAAMSATTSTGLRRHSPVLGWPLRGATRARSNAAPKKAPPRRRPVADDAAVIERARRDGKAAQVLATELLSEAGFVIEGRNVRLRGVGLTISLVARAADGVPWHSTSPAASRPPAAARARRHTVEGPRAGPRPRRRRGGTADPPQRLVAGEPGDADAALRSGGPGIVFDAIDLLDPEGLARLRRYAAGGLAGPLRLLAARRARTLP